MELVLLKWFDETFEFTGGTAYSLTAAGGSFVLTGEGSTRAIGFAAVEGSFTLTGETSARGITLAAAEGSFVLTGEATNQALGLGAAEGSFVLTGEAATLVYTPAGGTAYTLTAAQGSFSLTGEASTQAIGLGADQGSYSLTGETSGRGQAKPTAEGAFSLVGFAVAALRSAASAVGAFVYTGFAAVLSWSGQKPVSVPSYKYIPFVIACRLRSLQQGSLNVGNTRQNIANLKAMALAEIASPSNPPWAKYSQAPDTPKKILIYPKLVPGYVQPPNS